MPVDTVEGAFLAPTETVEGLVRTEVTHGDFPSFVDDGWRRGRTGVVDTRSTTTDGVDLVSEGVAGVRVKTEAAGTPTTTDGVVPVLEGVSGTPG